MSLQFWGHGSFSDNPDFFFLLALSRKRLWSFLSLYIFMKLWHFTLKSGMVFCALWRSCCLWVIVRGQIQPASSGGRTVGKFRAAPTLYLRRPETSLCLSQPSIALDSRLKNFICHHLVGRQSDERVAVLEKDSAISKKKKMGVKICIGIMFGTIRNYCSSCICSATSTRKLCWYFGPSIRTVIEDYYFIHNTLSLKSEYILLYMHII